MYALIIEPDEVERSLLQRVLCEDGWQITLACSMVEAQRVIESRSWNLVFCDAQMATKEEVDKLIDRVKREDSASVQLVLMATPGKSIHPFEAILNGAADYIRKPCREHAVREISLRARERFKSATREKEAAPLSISVDNRRNHDEYHLVGDSEAITEVYKAIARIIRDSHRLNEKGNVESALAFLITGETGTGKEIVARLIHQHSRYGRGAFVPVNCSNLSAELAESELFGSTPGAYTGAAKEEQPGLWELASGGTLFLDEITEAPRAVLPKLLRVLQDGQIKRLGAKRWIKVDTQVIAATNRRITEEIKKGHFRADLYHRLSLFAIHLPPLRERLDDVPLLALHFTNLYSDGTYKLLGDALQLLIQFSKDYEWPGNVRELENTIRRAITHSPDKMIYAVDLAQHLPVGNESAIPDTAERGNFESPRKLTDTVSGEYGYGALDDRVKRFRSEVVKETLAAYNGNRSRAAKSLQVSRSKMHRLVEELEQERELNQHIDSSQ